MRSIVHLPFQAFVLHLTHWHNDYCCACVHNKHEWFSANFASFNVRLRCMMMMMIIHHTLDGHARDPIHNWTRLFMLDSASACEWMSMTLCENPQRCSYQFIIYTWSTLFMPTQEMDSSFFPFSAEQERKKMLFLFERQWTNAWRTMTKVFFNAKKQLILFFCEPDEEVSFAILTLSSLSIHQSPL